MSLANVLYLSQSSSCLSEWDLQQIPVLINSILQTRREKQMQFSTTLHKNFPEEIPTGFTNLILALVTNRKNLKESEPSLSMNLTL